MSIRALFVLACAAALTACSELLPVPPETPEQALANAIRESGPCGQQVAEEAAAAVERLGPDAPIVNRIVLSGSSGIAWNDMPIDATRLRQYLDLMAVMRPAPLLAIRIEPGADPAHLARVRETIFRALNCEAALQ